MTNQERLTRAIDRLQHERAVYTSKIERLSQAQLDFKLSRQSWSAGQVTHHVGLAEVVWQGYLKSVLKDGDREKGATRKVSLEEVPFSSRIVPDFVLKSPLVLAPLSFMVNMLPRPFQSMLFAVPLIKMDASTRMQPKLGLPREQLLRFLDETRRETLVLLRPVEDWDLSRFRIIHPLVGDQDVYGILELIASHDQRHSQQLEAIKKNVAFPAAAAKPEAR